MMLRIALPVVLIKVGAAHDRAGIVGEHAREFCIGMLGKQPDMPTVRHARCRRSFGCPELRHHPTPFAVISTSPSWKILIVRLSNNHSVVTLLIVAHRNN